MSWIFVQHSCIRCQKLQGHNNFIPAQHVIHKTPNDRCMIHNVHSVLGKPAEWGLLVYMQTCKQKPSFNLPWKSFFFFLVFFFFLFLVQYIAWLPMWKWREGREAGFPHSVMIFMVSISVSVWANLLFPCVGKFVDALMKYNQCYSSYPIGPTNIISRC